MRGFASITDIDSRALDALMQFELFQVVILHPMEHLKFKLR